MAKPTYSIGNLDLATLQRVDAFLNGAVAGTTTPPPPVAQTAPPPPPLVAQTAPPPPVAQTAPPPPPLVAQTAPLVVPGGITVEQLVAVMAEKVGVPGKAAQVAAILAQYNAKEPGKAGPIGNVDPAQYTNLKAALDAL